MAEPREIHFHLTLQPGTTIRITADGDDFEMTSNGAEPATTAPSTTPDLAEGEVLESAIQRLEGSGTSQHIRKAVDGLLALGYVFKLPKTSSGKQPENYLRIIDPKYTAHGIGYLTPGTFSFTRTSDRDLLKDMPGASTVASSVTFPHVDSAQPGLDAAKVLRD